MKIKIANREKLLIITKIAMMVALSAVGAMIKLFNTIAFDSLPGYFSAIYLGNWYGALIISLGHMLTAITSGFPLGALSHIYIAIQMATYAYIFHFLYNKFSPFKAILLLTLLNGPISALLMVPIFGWGFFYGWSLPLSLASFANILLAHLIYKRIIGLGDGSFDREV